MNQREKAAIEQARRRYGSVDQADEERRGRLREQAVGAPPIRSLCEALSEDALQLIVEPKRATPERGTINPELRIADVARECQESGAAAVSVVTEETLSAGSLDDLREARRACDLPLLARDYIVHPDQVYELRLAGADALFIPVVAFVDEDEDAQFGLPALVQLAYDLRMEVMASVRSEEELGLALQADAEVINIDNRDDDGRVDVDRTFDLLAAVPVGTSVISESIANVDEVAQLHRAGVDALLLDEGHLETGLSNALAVFAGFTLD